MLSRPRILLVGDEPRLIQARAMVLGTRFEVHISARLSEALGLVLKRRFDLVVVLRKTESWREFAELISRQNSRPTIFAVSSIEDQIPSWADEIICTEGAFELLRRCTEHFGMTIKTKSLGVSDRSFKEVIPISSVRSKAS